MRVLDYRETFPHLLSRVLIELWLSIDVDDEASWETGRAQWTTLNHKINLFYQQQKDYDVKSCIWTAIKDWIEWKELKYFLAGKKKVVKMIKLKSLFRRGPSGSASASSGSSKQTNQISPSHSVGIKSSASTSSLDRIAAVNSGSASADLGATRKLSKGQKHSSKDKLNDLLKVGSKEKLFDDKKELKKQQKQQQKQMQQVAQQQAVHHQSSAAGEQRTERSHSKDFESAAFNGMQDVSSLNLLSPTHAPGFLPLFLSLLLAASQNGKLCKRRRDNLSLSIEFFLSTRIRMPARSWEVVDIPVHFALASVPS